MILTKRYALTSLSGMNVKSERQNDRSKGFFYILGSFMTFANVNKKILAGELAFGKQFDN